MARRPRRQFRGIEPVPSGSTWKWRAVLTRLGRKIVGPLRATQDQAAEDYLDMRARRASIVISAATLGEARAQVVAAARARGLPETTIQRQLASHGRWLESMFKPTAPMAMIDEAEVRWLVRTAREEGRHPNTLLQKDLPLLHACFAAAGLPSPVPAVRKQLRATLRMIPPQMVYFEPQEIAAVLQRIRTEEYRDSLGRPIHLPERQRHADLLELVVRSGIRSGELSRLSADDVDWTRRRLRVISKDRANPRTVELVGELATIVRRLCDTAEAGRRAGANPDALLLPGGMNTLANVCRHWKRRLGEKRLSARALRHTFVTGLHYSGAAPIEAMGLAGHRHLSTTDRYSHEISRRRADVVARWFEVLENPDGPPSGSPPPPSPDHPDEASDPPPMPGRPPGETG